MEQLSRKELIQRCQEIKKIANLQFNCNAPMPVLRSFVAEHEDILRTAGVPPHVLLMAELSREELDDYCRKNETLCADDATWQQLFHLQFPDLSSLVSTLQFPDVEEAMRRTERRFLSWRALYDEFMAVAEHAEVLQRVEALINNEMMAEDIISLARELYARFDLINYVLRKINTTYNATLVTLDPKYIAGLTYSHVWQIMWILEHNNIRFKLNAFVAFIYLLVETEYDPRHILHDQGQYLLSQMRDREDVATDVMLAAVDALRRYQRLLDDRFFHVSLIEPLFAYVGREEVLFRLVQDLPYNSSIMDYAIHNKNPNALRIVLSDPKYDTPEAYRVLLMIAVTSRNVELMRYLLRENKYIRDRGNGDLLNAIERAVYDNSTEIVCVMLESDVSDRLLYPMWVDAVEHRRPSVVLMMLRDGRIDPTVNNNAAFKRFLDNYEVVSLLLADDRVDPSFEENYAIRHTRNAEVARLLSSDPRVDVNEALYEAIRRGDADVVLVLLSNPRVDPSADDSKALTDVARYLPNNEIVKLLLADRRVNPAARGNEAYYIAKREGYSDLVYLLLADPRVRRTLPKKERSRYYPFTPKSGAPLGE